MTLIKEAAMTYAVTVQRTLSTGEGELHVCDTLNVEAPNERAARDAVAGNGDADLITRVRRRR